MIDKIIKYFPRLSQQQRAQLEQLMQLYPEWNAKINVISRKDIDNLEVNHLLHSMAIAQFINFTAGTRILDFGAGGGLPSIPLAVLFPEVKFHLIDRIGKKLKVAADIAEKAGLTNVTVQHGDIGECHEKFDFVVSRAVMPLPDLVRLCRRNVSRTQRNAMPNGLITLKGGNIDSELSLCKEPTDVVALAPWFAGEEFFETKVLTYTAL